MKTQTALVSTLLEFNAILNENDNSVFESSGDRRIDGKEWVLDYILPRICVIQMTTVLHTTSILIISHGRSLVRVGDYSEYSNSLSSGLERTERFIYYRENSNTIRVYCKQGQMCSMFLNPLRRLSDH